MTATASSVHGSLTATVRAADGVLFTATARSREALASELVSYIRQRCDLVLWPAAARNVHALIERGEHESAIDSYFANVGARWDEEWLEIAEDAVLRV